MTRIPVVTDSRSAVRAEEAGASDTQAACFGAHRMWLLAACTVAVLPMLALTGCSRSQAAIKLPDTDVLVATPVQRDVPVHSEWVATTDGYVNAEIRPQVSGYIIRQNYKEGAAVRRGDVLFEIDPRPFQ